ncbi:MAG TPA: hypothetical protein PKH39_06225 [Woeseiaceae bacterium]|nr:hypothetical protein [Woeseiaceae bacterium]
MSIETERAKSSTWSRVLAWVFVVFLMLGLIGWITHFASGGGWGLGLGVLVLGAMGSLLIVPLALSVAIRGRPPEWWSSIEDTLNIDKALRRYIEKRDR